MLRSFSLSLAVICLSASFAQAKELACWNLYSKRGTAPMLTATVESDDQLSHIVINAAAAEILNGGDPFDTKGAADAATGSEITTTRSPYLGAQEFLIADGIRLVLPMDLSSEGLASTALPGGELPDALRARQNGVLDVAGDRVAEDQGGDSYFRMHCLVH